MQKYYQLEVRDCQGVLWAFYLRYEGRASASFEGDLTGLGLGEIPGASLVESNALKRQTSSPELDFYVVPIDGRTIKTLKEKLSNPGLLGRNGRIIHTLLAVGGELIFSACDNFHDDCTVASCAVPEEFLAELKSNGVLRSYHCDA